MCHSARVASGDAKLGAGAGLRTVFYRGRWLGVREFVRIQRIVDAEPDHTRQAMAQEVCRQFQWRRGTGQFAVDSCRLLLLRLARRGWLRLPAPRRASNFAPLREPPAASAEDRRADAPDCPAADSGPLVVRPITPEERFEWRQTMARYHYLGCGRFVGESLGYAAFLGATRVALLAWAAAALKNPPRDDYLGWDATTRARRLPWLVNNVRFLILPGPRRPNLASRILATNLRRLAGDWQARFGHSLFLAETFVDRARFPGTCYRASNWRYLGDTRGFARRGARYAAHGQPKAVFVYPLQPHALDRLRAPAGPRERQVPEGRPMITLNLSRFPLEERGGLIAVLQQLVDPRQRRGIRHSFVSIMAIAVCATLAGATSLVAIAQWAQEQSPRTLRRLRCHRGHAPSEPTIRRVLGQLDVQALDQRVGAWLAQQTSLVGQGLAIDGKTLCGSADADGKAVHLVSAVLHRDAVVVAQHCVPDKTNEITSVAPLFATLDIQGAVVTGDAMFTQTAIAEHLVEAKHADYVFTVKDNQPTLRQDIADLHLDAFPPSAHDD